MKALLAGLLVALPLTIGQAPEIARVGLNTLASWTAVTVDVNGAPEVLLQYRVALFDGAGAQTATVQVNPDQTQVGIAALIAGVQNGYVGNLKVQAVDAAGNVSEWSDPLPVVVDNAPPAKPGRPGCQLIR